MKPQLLFVLPWALALVACGDGSVARFDPVTGTEAPTREVSGPSGERRAIGTESPLRGIVSGPNGGFQVIGPEVGARGPGTVNCVEGAPNCAALCACVGDFAGCEDLCEDELGGPGRPGNDQGPNNPGNDGDIVQACIDACVDAGLSEEDCSDLCQ